MDDKTAFQHIKYLPLHPNSKNQNNENKGIRKGDAGL